MEEEIKTLSPPDDSKHYLDKLKKTINNFKAMSLNSESGGSDTFTEPSLSSLITIYLDCPVKIPAKRVFSSFFQGLETKRKAFVEKEMCEQLSCLLSQGCEQTESVSVSQTRKSVDIVAALMENFKLGENCLSTVCIQAVQFLTLAEEMFLSQINETIPPVYLNELMHHCHVTMQTLNLLLQKTVVGNVELASQLSGEEQLMSHMMALDQQIIANESFLLDCRCCCAMNAVLLLQISVVADSSSVQISNLLFPALTKTEGSSSDYSDRPLRWLTPSQLEALDLDRMTPLTFLAWAYGYTAMVSVSTVLDSHGDLQLFFVEMLLPKLLDQGKSCCDVISKSFHGRTISLWASKMLSAVEVDVPEAARSRLSGQGSALQSLLGYVWSHWEDQLDAIRQNAKSIFESVIKIHARVNTGSFSVNDSFMNSLVMHLLTVSWTSRGKFSALTSCVHLMGSQSLLDISPNLPSEVLAQFADQGLSCLATELYTSLFSNHRRELQGSKQSRLDGETRIKTGPDNNVELADREGEDKFFTTWVDPVVEAVRSSNRKLKQNVIEYLLPKLMKAAQGLLAYMMNRLAILDQGSDDVMCQGAVVSCLHRARVMGLLGPVVHSSSSLWFGHLDPVSLRAALCCLDDQIRLDAFALVCESSKTTEAVTWPEIEMLRQFIPYNLSNQSPSFRQTLLALMKKLLLRMKDSRQAKNTKTQADAVTSLNACQTFLTWLCHHLLDSLYPGAAFARRTTALSILSLMTSIFTPDCDANFSLTSAFSTSHLHSLLDCLADTFEENKTQALTILTAYTKHCGAIGTSEKLAQLLSISMTLACSTNPQDCTTAAYIMLLLLRQPGIMTCLHHCSLDLKMESSVQRLAEMRQLYPPVSTTSESSTVASLYLLEVLCLLLEDQLAVARESLFTAAAKRPLYPTLHCIRYIMQGILWNSLDEHLVPLAKNFIDRLITDCLNLAEVVSPVVQNSSPEGNVPDEAYLGPGLNMGSLLPCQDSSTHTHTENSNAETPTHNFINLNREKQSQEVCEQRSEVDMLSRSLVESMPEFLVVCCWRSIKEVSLTLGNMCLQVPVDVKKDGNASLVSIEQIRNIGDYFSCQLLQSIHRGAFELAYAGFQLMAKMLWNHRSLDLQQLPSQWLENVMADIKSETASSKLCATRRSAGVPFFVQAITSTEPGTTGRKCFHATMKELLQLAVKSPAGDGETVKEQSTDAQVHALNIMRALYRDARLGEDVVPYIADGLMAAIQGFKSEQWAVRNSATLLLSALMTRMFGVKRSKDETAMSKKNCQTGRSFFYHYPSLYPFLLSELRDAVSAVCTTLHPSLYPVLLVLGRLFPSTLEGQDTSLSLSPFIPYIIRCASSPVLKTRVIAARALRPMARRTEVVDIGQRLLSSLCGASASHVHGLLLQLQQLMLEVEGMNAQIQAQVMNVVVPGLTAASCLLSQKNPCYGTRQACLLLIDLVLSISDKYEARSWENKGEKLVGELRKQFIVCLPLSSSVENRWKPLFYEFEKTRASLCLKHLAFLGGDSSSGEDSKVKDIVLDLLCCPLYEVRLQVLETLLSSLRVEGVGSGTRTGSDADAGESDVPATEEGASDHIKPGFQCSQQGPATESGTVCLVGVATQLFDLLLLMALETESHQECLEKVYLLLSSLPQTGQLLSQGGQLQLMENFTLLLQRLQQERRTEVQAAMMRFSGCFLSLLYQSLETEGQNCGKGRQLLIDWTDALKMCCQGEDNSELIVSCCLVMLDNAVTLFQDPQHILGDATLSCWDCLANFLQEDDLEIKDIAASVLCVVGNMNKESLHPSLALYCLPKIFLSVLGRERLPSALRQLFTWISQEQALDIQESSKRLFDKGEVNSYWDQVVFIRSLAHALIPTTHQQVTSDLLNPVDHIPGVDWKQNLFVIEGFAQCMQQDPLRGVVVESVSRVTEEMNMISSCCDAVDRFLNAAQYLGVCQSVFRAHVLLDVLNPLQKDVSVKALLSDMLVSLTSVVKDLQLDNALTRHLIACGEICKY